MAEPLLRDYSKTEAERREVVRQKFLALRESLDPAALVIFNRAMTKWYAATCEDDKATIERRRQHLLDIKTACLQHMSPKARELFDREIGPAARKGNCLAAVDPACQPEFEVERLTAQRVNEIWRKTQQVFHMAIARCDLTNANRALQNFTRIKQLERNAANDMEEQRHLNRTPCPPGIKPLPGTPGGRPLTEEENKFRKEFAGLSPADRT